MKQTDRILPRNTPRQRHLRPAALALALATAFTAVPRSAGANPSGGVAIVGQASMVSSGNKLTVTTQNGVGAKHSAINWQSFSIPAGSSTNFVQPSASSLSINRVVTNTPSQIFGTLSSNGRLVLVNQSGIAVGAGAIIDTAGFTASALRMTDADALAGRLRFGDANAAMGGAAGITVGGRIVAREGDVVLIAPNIDIAAGAVLQASNGSTVLAAGQQVEITGRGLEGISMLVQAPANEARNLGKLQGDAVGMFAGTLRHSGEIQATSATMEGGRVLLKAVGDAIVDGTATIVASKDNGSRGGQVDVLGNRVAVTGQAVIDVSASQGGGGIRIGGDFQGKNPEIQNAQRTALGPDAILKADATDNGKGGRIIVWADDQTKATGSISAQGGPQGGDGGFVEVSGKERLLFEAAVNLRAPHGAVGTLLLDPRAIDVQIGGGSAAADVDQFADSPGAGLTIAPSTLNAVGGNVTLQATENILFVDPLNLTTLNASLTVQVGGQITVNAPITTNAGAITLYANAPGSGGPHPNGSAVYVFAALNSTGGNITLRSDGDANGSAVILLASVNAGGGALTLASVGGDILQNSGAITVGGLTTFNAPNATISLPNTSNSIPMITGSTGALTVKTANHLQVLAGGINSNNGNVVLHAGGISNLNLFGNITAGTGTVTLQAPGGIYEPGGAVSGSALIATSLNSSEMSLTGPNNVAVARLSSQSGGAGSVEFNNLHANSVLSGSGRNLIVTSAGGVTIDQPLTFSSGIDITASSGNINLAANVAAGSGPLNLTTAGGDIQQTVGAVTVAGATTLSSGTGAIFLANAGNDFSSISVSGGNIAVSDDNALAVTAFTRNQAVANLSFFANGGALTLPAGAIDVGIGALQLHSGGAFTTPGALNAGAFMELGGAQGLTLAHPVTTGGTLLLQNTSGGLNVNAPVSSTGAMTVQVFDQSSVMTVNNNLSSSSTMSLNLAGPLVVQGSAAGFAQVYSEGNQTISARGILLQGASSGIGNTAAIHANGVGATQAITITGGANLVIQAGSGAGSGNWAEVYNEGNTQSITFTVGGNLAITAGSVGTNHDAGIYNIGGGLQSISGATSISLTGGASGGGFGSANAAQIYSGGSQSISVGSGGLHLTGGGGALSGNFASIRQSGGTGTSQTVNVTGGGSIVLQGGSATALNVGEFNGSYAHLTSDGDSQTITLTGGGNISLTGGSVGSANHAEIGAFFGSQSITGANLITLTGGASGGGTNGNGNEAVIVADAEPQTISANGILLIGGVAGTNNYAGIGTDGNQTINVGSGGLNLAGGGGGASDRENGAVVYQAGLAGTSQTINVTGVGGLIGLSGGNSVATNVGFAGLEDNGTEGFSLGSVAVIRADGDSQTIQFSALGGRIVLTGGTVGSNNIAAIQAIRGSQTIGTAGANAPSITVTGGASGGVVGEGNVASFTSANSQTINAKYVEVSAVASNAASIITNAGTQSITTNGKNVAGVGLAVTTTGSGDASIRNNVAFAAQNITVIDADLMQVRSVGPSGTGSASINSNSPQTVMVRGTGSNLLVVGDATGAGSSSIFGPNQTITAGQAAELGGIQIVGGTTGTKRAFLSNTAGGSNQVIATTGTLSVVGGSALSGTNENDASGAFIYNNGVSNQTVTANAINLQGGTGGSFNLAIIGGEGSQFITVGAGGMSLTGGSGSGIRNLAGLNQKDAAGTQSVTVNNGGSIILQGGSSSGIGVPDNGSSFAGIESSGVSQTITFTAGGDLRLTGGTVGAGNNALINTNNGTQTISGATLVQLRGGASGGAADNGNEAFINSDGNQSISAQTITVTGGAGGSENSAGIGVDFISSGNQSITANSITLQGGVAGTNNSAAFFMGNGRNQTINVDAGGLSLTGGGGGLADRQNAAAIFQNAGTGTQTINVGGGGAITLQAGSGAASNVGFDADFSLSNGSFASIVSRGTAQVINFTAAGGSISATGGTVGSNNVASIETSGGPQTIQGSVLANAPTISLTGGATGGNATEDNGGFIFAGGAGLQTISAKTTTLQTGGGPIDNSARIVAGTQQIDIAGNLSLTGGSSASSAGGARIGGRGITNTDLTLNVSGNLALTAGSTSGVAIGTSSASVGKTNTIAITTGGDLVMTPSANAGVRIGSHPSDIQGGSILVTAGGNITMNAAGGTGVAGIRSLGNVTLSAPSGSILEADGALIRANLLTASAASGINLDSQANQLTGFNATNTASGAVNVTNAQGALLTVSGISQTGGNVRITADDLDITGPIIAGTGSVTLRPTTLSRNVVIEASPSAGVLSLSTSEIQRVSANVLEIGRLDGTGNLDVNQFFTDGDVNVGTLRFLAGNNFNHGVLSGIGAGAGTFDVEIRAKNDVFLVNSNINLGNNQSLLVSADDDGSGVGDINIGAVTLQVGTNAGNTLGEMSILGQNIVVAVSGNGSALVSVAGSGLQSLFASNDITIANANASSGTLQIRTMDSGNQSVVAGGSLTVSGGNGTGASASLRSAGSQSIDVGGDITVLGGDGTGGANFAEIAANGIGGQSINLSGGGTLGLRAGGAGSNNRAYVNSMNGNQTITGANRITIEGGAAGGGFNIGNGASIYLGGGGSVGNQSVTVGAGGLLLQGGGGTGNDTDNSAFLSYGGAGTQTLNMTGGGDITVVGGSSAKQNVGGSGHGSRAGIDSGLSPTVQQIITLDGGDIALTGGTNGSRSYAAILADSGAQSITGATNITLTGGASGGVAGEGNNARLNATTSQLVTAQNIALIGGAGGAANIAQINMTGAVGQTQTVTASSGITLTGGAGGGGFNTGNIASIRTSSGSQVVSAGAGGISLNGGGGPLSDNYAFIYQAGTVGTSQTIAVNNGGSITAVGGSSAGSNVGGLGHGSFAGIQSTGDTQAFSFTSGGAINLTGGTVGSRAYGFFYADNGSQTITGVPNITLTGGASGGISGEGNTTFIKTGIGTQDIAAGTILLQGGSAGMANGAELFGTATQTISAAGITLTGGAGGGGLSTGNQARIGTNANQVVTVGAGGIHLAGGGGVLTDNSAQLTQSGIAGSTQNITVNGGGSITIQGGTSGISAVGSGHGSRAQIGSDNGNQTITLNGGGQIQLTGGNGGSRNYALIYANGGSQNITGANAITVTGGATGGIDGEGNYGSISASVGSQTILVGGGGITITGGSGGLTDRDNYANITQGGLVGTSQTVTVGGGGDITLQGGSSAGLNVGASNGSTGYISNSGDTQLIEFSAPGSVITITGGSVGSNNSAGILSRNGTQTIRGTVLANAPAILIFGGSSGGVTGEGNNAGVFANVGAQNITAGVTSLVGGAGGVESGASITAPTQTLLFTGNLGLTGGSNSDIYSAARIGGRGGASNATNTNLNLTVNGNLAMAGGATSGAAIGSTGLSTGLTNDIVISTGGDVTLNPSATQGVRIGSPSTDPQGGSISVTAGGNIAMNSSGGAGIAVVRSLGNVVLTANTADKSITEANDSIIVANQLTTSSAANTSLPGNNVVNTLIASSNTGNISFNNTQTLTVASVSTGAGNQVVNIGTVGGTSDLLVAAISGNDDLGFVSGGLTTLQGAIAARSLSVTSGAALNLAQNITTTGNLSLITPNGASNDIVQTGGTIVAGGQTSINAGTGVVFLSDANNNFNQIGVTGGVVTILDVNNVVINNSNVQNILLVADGSVTLAGTVAASDVAGTSIELVTGLGSGFVNSAGAGALAVAGSARWLVYSDDPALDTRGGLPYEFKQYNASFGDTILGGATQNGFIMAIAPSLSAGLQNTVSKVYNANTNATLVGTNYFATGLLGDLITLNNPVSGSYDNKNAGSGKTVTVNGVTVANVFDGLAEVFGYPSNVFTLSGAVGDISPASISAITGITAANKVYDTTTAAALNTGAAAFTGKVVGDVLTVASSTGNFVDKNAALGKTVNISALSLGGADAANYTLASSTASTTADITQASISSISGITANNKVYDGNTSATLGTGTAVFNGKLGVDVLTVGAGAGNFSDKTAALGKTVSISGLALGGADAANYLLGSNSASTTADITPATITLSGITASNKVYDGNTNATVNTGAITLGGKIGLDDVSVNGAGAGSFADKNAGLAKPVTIAGLSLAGADAANYTLSNGSAVATADITRAAISSISGITANNKTYDGNTSAVLDASGAGFTGIIGLDALTVASGSGTFINKNAALGKTVNITALALGGVDSINYTLGNNTASTTADIGQATIGAIGGITAANKVYDGNTTATVNAAAAVLTGKVIGDSLTVGGGVTAAFTDKNAGLAKTVNINVPVLAGADVANYILGTNSATASADISQASISAITGITAANKVYDTTTAAALNTGAAAFTGKVGGDVLTVASSTGNFIDKNAALGKVVNISALSLGGADAANYTLASTTASTTADITQASISTISGITANNKVYDGNTSATLGTGTAVFNGKLGVDVLNVGAGAGNFSDKTAALGKTVNISGLALGGADAANYTLGSNSASTTADITPATITLSGITADNKVYDGNTIATVNTGAITLGGKIGLDDVSVNGAGAGSFADKNAGLAKPVTIAGLSLTGADAANYTLSNGSAVATADITRAAISSISGITANNKTYDGNTSAVLDASGAGFTGIIGLDALTVASGSGTFINKNAALGKTVNITGLTLGGGDAINYTLGNSTASTTADIGQATISAISGITAANKVYDGNTTATVNAAAAVLTGKVIGDSLTVGGGVTAVFDTKNAGLTKTVNINVPVLAGADVANYILGTNSATANADITPASITVSGITAANKVYDATTAATVNTGVATLGGKIGLDDVSLTGGTGAFVNKNVGVAKTVNVTGLSLAGVDAANYTVGGSSTAAADITQASITSISGITANDKVYNRTTVATLNTGAAVFNGRLGADVLTVGAGSGAFIDKDVGVAKTVNVTGLALSGADSGNYSLGNTNASALASITVATISAITGITAADKVYDTTTNASLNPGAATFTGLLAGDSLTVGLGSSGAFVNKNAGVGKTVNITGLSLAGVDVGNYTLGSTTASALATITPAAISAITGITAADKVYNGNTTAALNTGGATFTGMLGADLLTVGAANGNFLDKNVGSLKIVNITGLTLAGADAGNYVLSNNTASSSASITPATITAINGITASKVYDGSANATPIVAGAVFVGGVAGDNLVVTGASGVFSGANPQDVGVGKPYDVTGISLGGADAANYVQAPAALTSTGSGAITQLASVAWVGSANDNQWSSTANWAGGAIPVRGNVATAVIPGGAGTVQLDVPLQNVTIQSGSPVNQSAGVVSGQITLDTQAGIALGQPGNQISKLTATNSGSGNILVNNSAVLEIAGMSNSVGHVDVTNIGAITTTGLVSASGNIRITANSPLVVGVPGIQAGGSIELRATNLSSAGDLTLNGPVIAGNTVLLDAGATLTQNSDVLGPNGVTANAGLAMVFGPLATTNGSRIGSPAPPQPDLVVAFLEVFEAALDEQLQQEAEATVGETNPDGSKKKKAQETIVTEGEVCK